MPTSKSNEPMKNNMLVVLGAGIIIGLIVGSLYTKVTFLEKGTGGNTAPTVQNTGDTADGDQPAKKVTIAKPDQSKDHWRGSKNSRYVMVEYSDFECPFCGRFFPTTEQIRKEYGDKLALVFRQFPLSFHPKAMPAAQASECVAELGGNDKFWQFHDELFTAMPNVEVTGFGDIAQKIGVNKAAFQKCLDSGKYKAKVEAQTAEGNKAGVAATPTSVLYDMQTGKSEVIEGALPYESVKTMIDAFIKG